MSAINFQITGDSRDLRAAVNDAQRALSSLYQQIQQGTGTVQSSFTRASSSIEDFANKAAKAFAGIKIAEYAKDLSKQILETRQEYQSIELSLNNLLGSAEKGADLFKQITKFSVETPMNEKDVAKGAQTLLGFGVSAEKVMPLLKQLGDVSMADAQRFQQLVLVMAQVTAAGKLQGQDLLQFVNAGFNPLQELTQITGRSMSNLKAAMTDGEISVEMVEQAIKHATSEGGKFYGMLNTMAGGIKGAQNALQGSLQKLENDIGQRIEQPLISAMNTTNAVVKNVMYNLDVYKGALVSIIAVLGTYKTAQLSVAAVNTLTAGGTQALTKALIQQKIATAAAAAEQKVLNLVMNMNPYVAAATALATLCGVLYTFSQRTTGAEYAQRSLNDKIAELDSAQEKLNNEVQDAIALATNDAAATLDRNGAMTLLNKKYDTIISKYLDEKGHLKDIIKLKQEIALLDGKRAVEDIRKDADKYDQYANAAKRQQGNIGVLNYKTAGQAMNNALMPGNNKLKNEAYAEYKKKTGAFFASDKDVQDYFTKMASGLRNEANKRTTAAQVASYTEGLGSMSSNDLKSVQRTLVETEATIRNAQKQNKEDKRNNKVVANVKGIGKGLDIDQVKSINTQITGILAARDDKAAKDAKEAAKKKKKEKSSSPKVSAADKKDAKEKKLKDKLSLKVNIDAKDAKEQLEQLKQDNTVYIRPEIELLENNIELAKDRFEKALRIDGVTADAKLELATNLANLQAQLDELTHGELTIKAAVEPEYIKKGSIQDKEKSYDNASNKASNIQSLYDKGLISQKDAQKEIDAINEELKQLGDGVKPIKLQVDTKGTKDVKKVFGTMQDGWGTIEQTVSGFQNLTDAIENGGNAWEQISGVMNAFFQIAEGITSIVQGIVSVIQLLSGATQEQTSAQEQQNIAQITGTAATIAQATASGTAAATETAETVATEANAKAKGSEAIANATSSGAKMPFPYNIIAISTGVAAVIAALASCFATGGIVPGASTTGDKVIARVNSGEMILNKSQQANLFKMINAGFAPATSMQPITMPNIELNTAALSSNLRSPDDYYKNVVFKQQGRDLIGVIQIEKNFARKSGRIYNLG
jgi:tape measure domain-containing protein